MCNVYLDQLTDSQLEAAIELGEGLMDVRILEHNRPCEVLESVLVMSENDDVYSLPTKVRYDLTLADDMTDEGEIDAKVYVSVSSLGIVGQF